jgi:hypothetical protein
MPSFIINYIFPVSNVIILSLLYVSHKLVHNNFYKPSKYIFPLYISISLSITVISLLFGLHTDSFTANDKDGIQYGSNWFEITKIINFPKEQLKRKTKNWADQIDIKTNISNDDTTVAIVIVDKTGSGNDDKIPNKTMVTEGLKSNIRMEYDNGIDDLDEFRDLLLPFIMTGIYDNMKHRNIQNSIFCAYYYTGEKNGLTNYFSEKNDPYMSLSEILSPKANDFIAKIKNANDKIKGQNIKMQKSNLINLLSSVHRKLIIGRPKSKKINLYIISDFISTKDGFNSKDLTDVLINFDTTLNISALRFYKIAGSDEDDREGKTLKDFEETVKERFQLKSDFKWLDIPNTKDAQTLLENLKLMNIEHTEDATQIINLYTPYFYRNTNKGCMGAFTLLNTAPGDTFSFKIKDYDNPLSLEKILFCKNKELPVEVSFHEEYVTDIKKTDTIRFTMPSALNFSDHVLAMDICSKKRSSKPINTSYFINIMPRLSGTSSYLLIVAYSSLLFSIILMQLYLLSFLFLLPWRKKITKAIKIPLLLLILFECFTLLYFMFNFMDVMGAYIFIILLLHLLFTLPRYILWVREKLHVLNQANTAFHLFKGPIQNI